MLENIPRNMRRGLSLAIPLLSAAFFFGFLTKILKIDYSTSLFNTGINIGILFGLLNIFLWWMTFQHMTE